MKQNRRLKKLNLNEMAEVYDLLSPYISGNNQTYAELILDVFRNDCSVLNVVYEKLTGVLSDTVDGVQIITELPELLRLNKFGHFISMMKER